MISPSVIHVNSYMFIPWAIFFFDLRHFFSSKILDQNIYRKYRGKYLAFGVDFACESLIQCDIEIGGKVGYAALVISDTSEFVHVISRVNSHCEGRHTHFYSSSIIFGDFWPFG